MMGGEIKDFKNESYGRSGGIVNVRYSGVFFMSGGAIYGNDLFAARGGIVRVEYSSTFDMSGGSIWGNNCRGGSAINLSDSFFEMSGGIIYGSTRSGTPARFANTSDFPYATLILNATGRARYGDGTYILPQADMQCFATDYTIIGR